MDKSFKEHLLDLKKRIIFLLITFIGLFVICYAFSGNIVNAIKPDGIEFVYLSPQEVLISQLRLSFIFAFIMHIPIFAGTAIEFVRAKTKTTIITILMAFICMGLFAAGVYFSMNVLLPFMMNFLTSIGDDLNIKGMISLENYVSFFIALTVSVGILCELPLISGILTKVGIITPALLKKAVPAAIVMSFIIGAIITPPDVISQMMVALPSIGVYFLSIAVSSVIARTKRVEHKESVRV